VEENVENRKENRNLVGVDMIPRRWSSDSKKVQFTLFLMQFGEFSSTSMKKEN
jgi:hypothetical protein